MRTGISKASRLATAFILALCWPLCVHAEPISATIFTMAFVKSIAISAAVSFASYGLQRLLIRPKAQQRGGRNDSVYIQDSQFGGAIPEIYGARPADGKGGIRLAGNIIDASTIRKKVSTSTVETGGKGGPKQKVENTSYFQDLDISYGRGVLRILKIWEVGGAGQKLLYDVTASGVTGVVDDSYAAQAAQNNLVLPDPKATDPYPAGRYGLAPVADTEGVLEVTLSNNAIARIYPGSETQLPDPLFETIHGVGSTPAYRGISHIVFENVDVTSGHPTYQVLVENAEHQTLAEMVTARALRAGLQASDIDMTALTGKEIRGFLIDSVQSPRQDLELAGRIYGADFYEGTNGKINGVLLSETVSTTLDADYLGAVAGDNQSGGLAVTVQGRETDESELPFRLEATCFDPDNNHEQATLHAARTLSSSRRIDRIDIPATLTKDELQKLVNRELQLTWRERGSYSFTTTHTYRSVLPSQKIAVPFLGSNREMRVRERRGTVPGLLTFTCVPTEGVVLEAVGGAASVVNTQVPAIPANTVVTLIDVPRLYSPQDVPGFMWASAPKDANSGEWSRSVLWINKGGSYQFLDSSEGPATMGRVITASLPDVPGGWTVGAWDTTSTITVDLFYGSLETKTEAQVLEGANLFAIGNEVVGVRDWVRVTGHPNRWTGDHMQRRLKGTASTGHAVNERVVLLNNAVRFVKVDTSEQGIARTYKATTVAPAAAQPVADAASVAFTWTGESIPEQAVIVETVDSYGGYYVDGDQVLTTRQAAIADVTAGTGSTVSGSAGGAYSATEQQLLNDALAQINTLTAAVAALKTQGNTTVNRLENHGLIEA